MVNRMTDYMNLTLEQQEAICEIDHNLQIIACAGSGKTEVITRRIANILVNKPEISSSNIVAFTFTEKAADSMKHRIDIVLRNHNISENNDMYIGTIHGFCFQLLKKYTEKFSEYKILDTVKNHLFINRYFIECGMKDLNLDPYPKNINLFLQCIDKLIDDYENASNWSQNQREILEKYIECLYSKKYLDFSLLIFETLRQIDSNPNVKEYLSNIKYLIVDEYQDINDLQEKLIYRIAQSGANICVVGDDDQTIYQFRGSNADNMISFSKRYKDVHQVKLEKNFRCAPEIVDIAACVIDRNERRLVKKMVSGVTTSSAVTCAIRYLDKEQQFEGIANQILKLYEDGITYSEIAILVRKGKAIHPIVEELARRGIPFETDSSEHFFKGNYFNRFVVTLQILNDVNKAKLYDCWQDVVDINKFNIGFKYLRSCARGASGLLLSEILSGFCEKISFVDSNSEDIDNRLIALNGITKILNDYDEIYGDWQISARISGVLKFLGTQAADEYKYHNFNTPSDSIDAIKLMTVHKAKGLEFHTVFLPELMKREFPVSKMGGKKYWHVLGGVFEENKDKYESDLEDERKLFYVAITRAKQNLYMSYELSSQQISCFVKESADSQYLNVDRRDFSYTPKDSNDGLKDIYNFVYATECMGMKDMREGDFKNREYWENVRYARKQLYDYYGTACHFCPAAHSDLIRVKQMSPDEILYEAEKNGLL